MDFGTPCLDMLSYNPRPVWTTYRQNYNISKYSGAQRSCFTDGINHAQYCLERKFAHDFLCAKNKEAGVPVYIEIHKKNKNAGVPVYIEIHKRNKRQGTQVLFIF